MQEETVEDLRRWFESYVRRFESEDPDRRRNIVLKKDHTRRVCQEVLDIGERLGLCDEDLRLAEVMALFHDIGRFQQYARYGTFSDRRSVDHARLGVEVLREEGVLEDLGDLDDPTREQILRVISYHNRMHLPPDETERCLFFARLLRDADKLDIMWVIIDDYRRSEDERNGALDLDLPDTPGISARVYEDLMAGNMVRFADLQNLNDFKLLRASWVYDFNFVPALRSFRERGYLDAIYETIPASKEVGEAFGKLRSRLDERIREKR